MKTRFSKLLKVFIDWLTIQHTKLLPKTEIDLPYNSLSPTDSAERVDDYLNAIEWALSKRKKIRNVAIAGPYGAGKSSIINTFQKRHENKEEYKFLNISLATFKEENGDKENEDKDDLLRLIELSILQQLFYHEKDTKIPDSRFKKIKSQNNKHLLLTAIGLSIFMISFLYLVFPDFLAKFSIKKLTLQQGIFFHYTSVIIVALGILFMTFKSIRTLKRLSIKKFGISNASIEIDDKISKSILNNHIDEILYFFEVTEYNTVIIEDLDRFEQTDVFTKLREINLLINNSKKIENDVVFIYAIRDDMFQDKDRTKFFDFMIPIIPIINSSNSNDKLLKLIRQNKYNISESLVDDISLFIDDMRLLYNIMNEYHLYSKKLNKTLSQDKLLSMIVYKNIYPNDFTKLSQNDGKLYHSIIDKHQYLKEEISKINGEIDEIKKKIEKYASVRLSNVKELRMVYLYKIIEKIKQNSNAPFHNFWINGNNVSISKATEEKKFNLIINTKHLQYTYHNDVYNRYTETYNFNFTALEKEINPELTYKEREGLIINSEKIEAMKNKLEKLENKKNEIKKFKLKDLITNNAIIIKSDNDNQGTLINLLLRNGYIDEDYLDYISIFYEGSLTKNDHQFLINVKTQQVNEFDFPLQKKDNLLKRINEFDFEKQYALNYDLLDFILESPNYSAIEKKYFIQLSSETGSSIKFIDGFIERTANIEVFIKHLCKEWSRIWDYIVNQSHYPKDKVDKYFQLIIEHAEIQNIKTIFSNSIERISKNEDFLLIIQDTQKLKEIIKELDIKFHILNESAPKVLLDYVYSHNHYAINRKVVRFFLDKKITPAYTDIFNIVIDFEKRNYSIIKLSKLDELINYIDNNIDEYVTNIYLGLDTNTDENIEYYTQLLNNKNISKTNKTSIISQVKTLVDDINKIEDFDIVKDLLEESKMEATWDNLIKIYVQSENKFIPEMTSFINLSENAKALSNIRIQTDLPDEETVKLFLKSLLLNNEIENETYSNILSSIPYIYHRLSFDSLSFEKVKSLITNKKLTTNTANFELLKQNFENLYILLIEQNPDKFSEDINSFNLTNEDLSVLLKSNSISIPLKEEIIKNYDEATLIQNSTLLTQIGKLLLKNNTMSIDNSIILAVGTNSNLQEVEKIRLFNQWNRLYEKEDISNLLISLGEPYSTIVKNEEESLLENNKLNEEFVKNLKLKEYISKYKIENKKGIIISTDKDKE